MSSSQEEKSSPAGDDGFVARIGRHLELLATILLAVAAVATAWSSYQSARWSGTQAIDFSHSNTTRVESTQASTAAGQQEQVDVLLFTQWSNAYAVGDKRLSRYYFDRFRDEFKPAIRAWIATDPLHNPDAPSTPFAMKQYKLAKAQESKRLAREADRATADAHESNQRSDNYVLAVVLFAAALFFAGISTKLRRERQRAALLGFGYLIFIGTLIWVATFPITIEV